VLSPVIVETTSAVGILLQAKDKSLTTKEIISLFSNETSKILSPVENFLELHIGKREREFFSGANTTPKILILIPAFVLTELRTAFEMALYLFIPFFIIDLVITSLLTAMGMMMINPVNLTFPIKLILFINCDGWLEITKSLIASYK
jgi:type III secretory pathway component EscR